MQLEKNDVFVTNFWGCNEVCMVLGRHGAIVSVVRLEAIRDLTYATFSVGEFEAIQKNPLHKSVWYDTPEKQLIY